MSIFYGIIVRRLNVTPSRAESGGSFSGSNRIERRFTIMCSMLAITFLTCWIPFHAVHLAKLVGITNKDVRNR